MLKGNEQANIYPSLLPHLVVRDEYFGALIFNKRSLAVTEINNNTRRLLSLINGEQSSQQIAESYARENNQDIKIVLECINKLAELGILNFQHQKTYSPITLRENFNCLANCLNAPLGASIELTNKCNLNCLYCFQGASKNGSLLNRNEIYDLLEEFATMQVFTVFFGGGEPLLRPDFKEIAEYALALGFEVGISSNGTLITPGIAEWCASTGLDRGLQISVDGASALIHDALRGKGSFDKTVAGIRTLAHYDVHPSIAVTVTTINLNDIVNLVDWAIDEGLRHLHVMCLLPSGNAVREYNQLEPNYKEWSCLETELSMASERVKGKLTVDWGNRCYKPPYPEFSENDYPSIDKTFTGCPAGKTKTVIGCFGDVYGCDVLKRDEMIAGNIKQTRFSEIWRTSPVFEKWRKRRPQTIQGKCSKCKWLFACIAGCPAVSEHYGFGFFGSDPTCPHNPEDDFYLINQ